MTTIKAILNNWINNNIINENDIPEILKVYSKFFFKVRYDFDKFFNSESNGT